MSDYYYYIGYGVPIFFFVIYIITEIMEVYNNVNKEKEEEKMFNHDEDVVEEKEDDEEDLYECEECGEEELDGEDVIFFEALGINICKPCIDKEYPREKEVVEKVVEKKVFVEKETPQRDVMDDYDRLL